MSAPIFDLLMQLGKMYVKEHPTSLLDFASDDFVHWVKERESQGMLPEFDLADLRRRAELADALAGAAGEAEQAAWDFLGANDDQSTVESDEYQLLAEKLNELAAALAAYKKAQS